MGPPSTKNAFAGRPVPVVRNLVLPSERTISYAETGRADGPLVVLVHGTPGSSGAFSFLMADSRLATRVRVVSVDRLGWGKSAEGGIVTSMAEQAAAVRAVIGEFPSNRPVIAVGHSLGGPVVARLAMDYPNSVQGLVLVAASIDPFMEKTEWYQVVSRWTLVRWAVPGELARADREIDALKAELAAMLPLWRQLRLPVTVLHGTSDSLVPVENAAFAERTITEAPLTMRRIPKVGHLIPWERPELIRTAILEQLGLLSAKEVAASR